MLWSGDVPPANASHNPLTVTMDQDRTSTAVFEADMPSEGLVVHYSFDASNDTVVLYGISEPLRTAPADAVLTATLVQLVETAGEIEEPAAERLAERLAELATSTRDEAPDAGQALQLLAELEGLADGAGGAHEAIRRLPWSELEAPGVLP